MNKVDKAAGLKILVGYLVIIVMVLVMYGLLSLCSRYTSLFPILLIGPGSFPIAVVIGHILLGD